MIRLVYLMISFFFLGEHIMATSTSQLSLSSPAFQQNKSIPSEYTCDGANISVPLQWEGVPVGTQTFVIICEDPDVPHHIRADGMYDHWVLFNIPATVSSLPEDLKNLPEGTVQGVNTSKKLGYTGPCPPDRQHRYFFKIFALDTALSLPEGASKVDVIAACQGHILAQGELMGVYNRPQNQR
jgi:Raf kinase inhibitor-like YbhB/YbcL family protein